MSHFRVASPLVTCHPFAKPGSLCLSVILSLVSILLPAFGQQQGKPTDHEGGGHSHLGHAVKVPFNPGPVGPDGKVHQVVPTRATSFPNETETPQIEEARTLAKAGIFTLTSKPPSASLSSKQLSLLHWNPSKLNPSENPLLGSELLKQPVEPAAMADKRILKSSVPQHGPDFSGIGATGYFPPDGGVAAGPLQVVEVVNSSINVYDKNGNLLSSQTLNNFFSSLGTPGSDFLFDPSIYYDFLTGRFWVLATSENDNPNRSNLLLAVSATSDVTQGWLQYWLDATVDGSNSSSNWCDYPHLGMDADAVYMSCDQFAFPRTGKSAGSFQYAKVRIMTWDEFTNDTCCSWWDFWNLKEGNNNGSLSFVVRPALERFVGHGFGDFWVDAEGGGGSGSTLKVWQLSNPTACCDGSGGPTLGSAEQGVGGYGVPPTAAQPLNNGQTVQNIDSGDTRVLFAIYQFGHLSIGQNIACTQGGTTTDACAGFTEMDVSGYPTINNINDWYYSQPAGEDVYFPFVDQNINSDKTMVYSRSDGSSVYPGAYYTTIPNSGACTFCTGGETTMQSGSATYVQDDTGGNNRWGDYHGAGTDPDLLGIWVEGEYASSTNVWSTDVEPTYNSYSPIDSPSPTSVPFGNQAVFSSSGVQTVTFTNTGNAALLTSSTYISGDGDFQIFTGNCSFVTLQPGNSCSEGVYFSPTSVGAGSAFIVVLDNSPAGFADAVLSGTGVQAGTSTSISSSLNPSTYGQSVTFSARVVSLTSGVPTGSVTFVRDGSATLGTVPVNGVGVASLSTSSLGGGVHTISATYNGSTLYLASSTSMTQTVNAAPSTTAMVSSLNPSTYGQAVKFTATVSSGAGTPGGSVTFKDGATSLGTAPLAGGTAALTTSALTGGTHSITADYNGSANIAGSNSGVISQVVNKAGTASKVASSVDPSSWHQTVTFTAKVTSSGGIPAGTVTFKNGAVNLGAAALNGAGVATLATNVLIVGAHSITVVYNGNGNFVGSTSAALTQTVHRATTKTALVSSKNPSTHGTAVTFTATITPAFGGVATGKVTFKDGNTVLGTGTVNAANKATFTTSALGVGTHSITAAYPGDIHLDASTSPVLKQVVK